ncbi:hypothetical protein [Francisella tularensis]|uniref:Subunit ChlI of Mg-chelatase family protein n=2 Tax=Francisella tularensis TaxID=263 RepID=A0AAW3D6U8_FRATU|nr:subunit ChlI of Mg-chelatase family protein [Francisella tularensis subsp. tularensis SCHU S4]AJI70957.1 subunit ChlI of Mg-chelatase family protein [Francisella tularensis subsp. tularensis]AKE20081.1 subunit ChlI of Mg-chelatase family protein [Francisella tularensis subsp. tularensis str. SCHU S4 substr. NR-28534]EZK39379.1 hypothetical protein P251_02115 [Francisella tularensis subsp. tularensis str. SCHU S4 substr. FTS-634/635]EZK41933.1 hypothetical protein P250_02115 [Francisella tula
MSLAVLKSRAQLGIEAPLICIEVHLSNGLPGLSIVGLPEAAVKEKVQLSIQALISLISVSQSILLQLTYLRVVVDLICQLH